MKHFYTVYDFGSSNELISDCFPLFIWGIMFLIGLGIFLHAKYYISPDDSREGRLGYPIRIARMRTGAFLFIPMAAFIPFCSYGIYSSYMRSYTSYKYKTYKVVEGIVQDLHDSTRLKNSTLMLFSVDTVKFKIDIGHGNYDQISRVLHNNPNTVVRISYLPDGIYNREILKAELAILH